MTKATYEALPGRHIGEVRHPQHVRLWRLELAVSRSSLVSPDRRPPPSQRLESEFPARRNPSNQFEPATL
jgi:hypothetical protein